MSIDNAKLKNIADLVIEGRARIEELPWLILYP
jgi:hypothetical protein